MGTDLLDSPNMARKRYDDTKPKLPTDIVRLPARMTRQQRDMIQQIALFWLRKPIEVVAGEWLVERIEAEYKAGPKAADAKKKK